MKIHCLEEIQMGDDIVPQKELKKMIGYYEPIDNAGQTTFWEVTTLDNGRFTCQSQFEAEVVSSLEMIKAMLIQNKLEQEEAQKKAKETMSEVMGMMDNPLLQKFMPKLDREDG